MTEITSIEYIDYDESYGLLGKCVARSDVRGMTADERAAEAAEMIAIHGGAVVAREVETVPAVGAKPCDRCGEWTDGKGGKTATTHQEWRQNGDADHWDNRVSDRCDDCAQALREYANLAGIRDGWVWVKDERIA